MNFEFSEEQEMLRDKARRLLEDRCDTTAVRKVLDSDAPMDKDLWAQVADLGWLATALPEAYGGFGMGYLELCVLAEELGRAVAPVPFSSSVYLAMEAVLAGGNDAQKNRILTGLADGSKVGSLALAEGPGVVSAQSIATKFDGEALHGVKVPVPDAAVADILIVTAREKNAEVSLFLVETGGSGYATEPVTTIDESRSHSRVELAGVAAERLGRAGQGLALLDRIHDRAAVPYAFEQLGGAQAALEMGLAYAKERFAFGRPIGSFQAIKHRLAEMYCAVELARSNCYYAAWALSNDSAELPVAAATARLSAGKAFHECAKENIQVHGGMGFTWEFDCHLYYRRSKLLALAIGSEFEWKQKLMQRLASRSEVVAASEAA